MKNLTLFILMILLGCYTTVQAQEAEDNNGVDFYVNEEGRLFAPLHKPVYLFISHDLEGSSLQLPFQDKKESNIFLNPGQNLICRPVGRGQRANTREFCLEVWGDGVAPETSLEIVADHVFDKADTMYAGEGVQLQFTAHDDLSGVREILVSQNGAPFTPSTQFAFSPTHGYHTLRFYATDHVGNREETQTRSFFLDLHKPVTQAVPVGNFHNNVLGLDARIRLKASDPNSTISQIFYQLNDLAEQPYSSDIILSGLKNKTPHRLRYFAIDNAGNREETQTYNFYYDTIPPTLTYTLSSAPYTENNIHYFTTAPQITFSAEDHPAGVKDIFYRYQNLETQTYNTPFTIADKAGMHFVRYRALDNAANLSHEETLKIYIDNTPPVSYHGFSRTIFWNADTAIVNPATGIRLTATDMESGVETLFFSINNTEKKPYTDTIFFSEPGTYKLIYHARDYAGNYEQENILHIRSEPESAVRQATIAENPTQWIKTNQEKVTGSAQTPFYINISFTKDQNAPSWFLVNPDAINKEDQLAFSFPTRGEKTLGINATEKRYQYRLYIDDQPPATKFITQHDQTHTARDITFFNEGLTVTLKSSDNTSGVISGLQNIFYSLNGSPFTVYNSPLNIFRSEGPYSLMFYATDSVGNTEKINTREFIIDLSPPITHLDIEGPVYGNYLSAQTSLVLTSEDELSGVKSIFFAFNNEDFRPYRTPLGASHLNPLGEGSHTFRYYAVDNVGNKENPRVYHFSLDLSAPDITLSHSEPFYEIREELFITNRTQLFLHAREHTTSLQNIRYRIGNNPFVDYQNSSIQLPERDGRLRLTYLATDILNNENRQQLSVFIDNTPPTTSAHIGEPYYRNENGFVINRETPITLQSTDNGSGVKNIYYRIGQGSWQRYNSPITITGTGVFTISYRAEDNLGNMETPKTLTVQADNTSPQLSIQFRHNMVAGTKEISAYTPVVINGSDNMELTGLYYQVNDSEKRVYRQPLYHFTSGQRIKIKAIAIDRIGNRTEITDEFVVK